MIVRYKEPFLTFELNRNTYISIDINDYSAYKNEDKFSLSPGQIVYHTQKVYINDYLLYLDHFLRINEITLKESNSYDKLKSFRNKLQVAYELANKGNSHYGYRPHKRNLGNILQIIHLSENYVAWKKLGMKFFDVKKISISPSDLPKDVRKYIIEEEFTLSYADSVSEDIKFFIQFIRVAKEEKIIDTRDVSISRNYEGERSFEVIRQTEKRHFWADLRRSLRYIRELVTIYNYDLKSLLRFVHNYIVPYENLDVVTAYELLRDYCELNVQLGITKYNKYPKFLKSRHDILSNEFNNLKIVFEEELFLKKIKLDLEYNSEKFKVLVPKCSQDIKTEGKNLNHCVGSYIKRVMGGECQILFYRKDETKSLVTLEVRGSLLIQAKGYNNREITKEEKKDLVTYCKVKKLQLKI